MQVCNASMLIANINNVSVFISPASKTLVGRSVSSAHLDSSNAVVLSAMLAQKCQQHKSGSFGVPVRHKKQSPSAGRPRRAGVHTRDRIMQGIELNWRIVGNLEFYVLNSQGAASVLVCVRRTRRVTCALMIDQKLKGQLSAGSTCFMARSRVVCRASAREYDTTA